MKHALLFPALLALSSTTLAQVPIIDYGFLVDDPAVVVNNVLVQPDGKILVGGFFQNYAGSGHDHLVRLNNDGTIDPTFNPNGAGPGNAVEDMVLMPDGRILIAGNFLTYNGGTSYFIARLLADGTLDNTFTVQPNSINGAVWAIELHDNHKVLAGGEFFICSGESRPHIVQFNDNGSVDSTFVVGTGFDHNVHDILVLPDMRVVVGGQFTMYNGSPSGHIALLSPQGPIDPSMDNDPGLVGGGGIVRSLARQPDGKILAGGYFQYHDGQARSAVERLNLDGTHDPGFTSPLYAYSVVRALAVQADGKILVGGEFTATEYANMVPGPERLVRVLPDGTRDAGFGIGLGVGPGTQTTGYVHTLAVQPDSKILVGGHFETVDTETQFHQIVRLLDGNANGLEEMNDASTLSVLQDPNTGGLFLQTTFGGTGDAVLQLHGPNGQLVHTERLRLNEAALIPLQVALHSGLYLVSLTQGDQRVTAKVILE
ncbi:MAG: T9SS type A sorting domain-containing protein [Flavobacteriales bacterium]|nr:T9SS type A sorting domain-containing protein [Flavobacteriales bacterium]